MERTKHLLNCFCSRRPLLAMYGRDDKGRTYVHVKAFKQQRIFVEFIAYGGEVLILCRECRRWHRIVFKKETHQAELREMQAPAEVTPREGSYDGASTSAH